MLESPALLFAALSTRAACACCWACVWVWGGKGGSVAPQLLLGTAQVCWLGLRAWLEVGVYTRVWAHRCRGAVEG